MKEIYIVTYSYYSDWEIYGYFTNREDADKYCVTHPKMELEVFSVPCYDNIEDFSNIKLRYCHEIIFTHRNFSHISVLQNAYRYKAYINDFPKSNKITVGTTWIEVEVNTDYSDKERATKTATDLLYQFLDFRSEMSTNEAVEKFNTILSAEETERKRREKEQREKDLQELEWLKAKYDQK